MFEDNWSASVLKKKIQKLIFFFNFLAKIINFLYEIEFYMKNAFSWWIIVDVAQKLRNLELSLIFSNFVYIFNICHFFVICGKNNLKKAQISWKWSKLMWKHDFWPFGGSRAEKDRGAPGSPPPAPGKAFQTSPLLGLS